MGILAKQVAADFDAQDAAATGQKPAAALPAADLRPTADLLADVLATVDRFVVLPGPAERLALGLWALHSWAFSSAHCTPYLLVLSPERRAGKTRLLEVLELLAARPWRVAGSSEAVMFRKIEAHNPTLLLDEVDAIFGSHTERTEPLRAVLNAGNRPGSSIPRCVGEGSKQTVVDFDVYCAKVLAGIDTGQLPDTIVDRAITVTMKRRTAAEPVQRFRHRHAKAQTEPLREQLAVWAAAAADDLRDAEPELPAELNDRAYESWEPLVAIADHAGEQWGELARKAAVELSAGEEDESSRGTRLLTDLRAAFNGATAISTEDLLAHLNGLEESSWGGWHEGKGMAPRDLARLLRPYKTKPKTVRLPDGRTPKGYHRHDLEDAWKRYCSVLPTEAPQAPHPQHVPSQLDFDVADVADGPPHVAPHPVESAPEAPRVSRDVADVADVALLSGRTERPSEDGLSDLGPEQPDDPLARDRPQLARDTTADPVVDRAARIAARNADLEESP